MRVLYLIDSLIAGGAERSLAALAPRYADLGVRLDVAYLFERDNVWLPALEAAGAGTISLAGPGGRFARVRRARELIKTRAPDVLHTTLFEADIVGRVAALGIRVPVVSSLVNAGYGPEQLTDPRLKAWKVRAAQAIDAATARRVQRFHAVSTTVADEMAPRLHVARDRIDVIPRGRDPGEMGRRSASRRAAARALLGVNADDLVVLAVGRHEFQKGFDVLLDAFERLRMQRPSARLLIAGRTGAESDALRAQATASAIADGVTFLGFRADVPDLLCAADVFAAPSRWEGSPGGVIEAMALETPIVVSDIASMREVLGDPPCGLLVPQGDAGALASALVVAAEGDGTSRVAAARERFVDSFTIEPIARRMVAFYQRAIASKRASSPG